MRLAIYIIIIMNYVDYINATLFFGHLKTNKRYLRQFVVVGDNYICIPLLLRTIIPVHSLPSPM